MGKGGHLWTTPKRTFRPLTNRLGKRPLKLNPLRLILGLPFEKPWIAKKTRKALICRETRETQIRLKLTLDGKGVSRIQSPVPFLNHMLELMTLHGSFDLELKAQGDVDVGFHHTVEDIGICLGDAFSQCWGDLKGVQRYGSSILPMDEALVLVAVDISRRPHLAYEWKTTEGKGGRF